MLDRDLNGLRTHPVPTDMRRLMYKMEHAQGVDITRIFCDLNEVRSVTPPIYYALEAEMIPRATLCITFSPVHTVEYYIAIAERLIKAGASEIYLRGMAGVSRPEMLGRLTKATREQCPEIIIQYHGHSGPGFSMASILEICEDNADITDVTMEPILWEEAHSDIISVQAMLKDTGFQVPEIDMKAYMKVRTTTQEFVDDFLGYSMDPTNRHMSPLLLECGLPGGMVGSMMTDLKGAHSDINLILRGKNEPELSIDDLLVMLSDEVGYVWPKLDCLPLVTPFSQYMKNVALMNMMSLVKGEERWMMIDDHTWDMILGKSGRSPSAFVPEIIALAKEKGYEFTSEGPQKNYPDRLDEYRKEMTESGWNFGQDDEELFGLIMHDRQYRNYKSGVVKRCFEDDLQRTRDATLAKQGLPGGEVKRMKRVKAGPMMVMKEGQIIWEIDVEPPSVPPEMGHKYDPGDVSCCTVAPWHTYDKMLTNFSGRMIEAYAKQGALADKGGPLTYIERYEELTQSVS